MEEEKKRVGEEARESNIVYSYVQNSTWLRG